jgi:hypothetical protein
MVTIPTRRQLHITASIVKGENQPRYVAWLSSTFEIDLDGLDEGQEPREEFLMHGVAAVGFERDTVFELHNASEFVTLGAGGEILAHPGLEQAGYLTLELADGVDHVLLLIGCDTGLPAEREGVDEHGDILTGGIPPQRFRHHLKGFVACNRQITS